MFVRLRDVATFRQKFIMINSQNIHEVISRIPAEILLLIYLRIRRIRPEDVIQSTLPGKIIVSCREKSLVLLFRAKITSPPEPASYVFVPRTEDYGYPVTLRIAKRIHKIRRLPKPGDKFPEGRKPPPCHLKYPRNPLP